MALLLGTTPGDIVQASGKATQALLDQRERAAAAAVPLFAPRTRSFAEYGATPAVRAARAAQEAEATKVAQRAEDAARLARLPKAVQKVAHDRGLTGELDVLEAAAHVIRSSERMGGEGVAIYRADLAQALQCDTKRAEDLLAAATARGLIRQTKSLLNGGWYRSAV